MANSDLQRIIHIKSYCEDIESFLDSINRDYESFLSDRMHIRGVAMCILQIGENASGLSDDYRKRTVDKVNWQNIRGMRNLLTHNYGIIDNEILWDTAINDIPKLHAFCENELNVDIPEKDTPPKNRSSERDER